MNCMRCGGKGKPDGCPTCGKKIVMPEIKQEFLSNSKIIDWDIERLNKDNPNLVGDKPFDNYVKVLNGIIGNAKKGLLAKKSILISSPRGMGKHTFINCMFAELERNGLKCHPIIDHNEYLRTVILCTERPFGKHKLNLDDIIDSDVAAISIDYDNRFAALRAIRSILEKRGNMEKPTFIISDFPLSALQTGNYSASNIDVRYKEGRDELRYCRVISTFG